MQDQDYARMASDAAADRVTLLAASPESIEVRNPVEFIVVGAGQRGFGYTSYR